MSVDSREKTQKHQSQIMKCFTERSNGEFATDVEVSPSPPASTRASIGLSPFDMTKVRAALAADCVGANREVELHQNKEGDIFLGESKRSQLNSMKCSGGIGSKFDLPHQSRPFSELDENIAHSMLVRIEEFLYTIELEEELLRRDFIEKRTARPEKDNELSCIRDEVRKGTLSRVLQEFWPRIDEPLSAVPIERQDQITKFVRKRFECGAQDNKKIPEQMSYSSVIESIVESVIKDIACEVEDVISEAVHQVVSIV